MENSKNLSLPYIMPSQAQKHVTHNEAIRMLDALVCLAAQSKTLLLAPEQVEDGARFIVADNAQGVWQGRDGQLACWQDGAWAYFEPKNGWQLWVADEGKNYVYINDGWSDATLVLIAAISALQNLQSVGINAQADDSNRLTVSSDGSLFTHLGADHRVKVNKAAAGDTASLLFQQNWSGRAEMGLAGADDFSIRVSADGASWRTAIEADAATGAVRFPNGGDAASLFDKAAPSAKFYVDPINGDDANDGLTVNSAVKSFQGLDDLLPAYTSISIQLLGDIICDHQIRFLTMCPNISIFGRASDDSAFQKRKVTVADAGSNQCGGIGFFASASAYLNNLEIDLVSSAPRSFMHFVNCLGFMRTANCTISRSNAGNCSLFGNGFSFVPSFHTNLNVSTDAQGYVARGLGAGQDPNADWRYPSNLSAM